MPGAPRFPIAGSTFEPADEIKRATAETIETHAGGRGALSSSACYEVGEIGCTSTVGGDPG